MGSIGLRKVRIPEAPEASGPDFIDMTVLQASLPNVKGRGAKLGASGRGG
jgi:hypothetical protein